MRRFVPLGPYSFQSTTSSLNLDLGNCQMPVALICFFVDQDKFQGKSDETPLSYDTLPVTQALARYGGLRVPSNEPSFNFGGTTLVTLICLI